MCRRVRLVHEVAVATEVLLEITCRLKLFQRLYTRGVALGEADGADVTDLAAQTTINFQKGHFKEFILADVIRHLFPQVNHVFGGVAGYSRCTNITQRQLR